MSIRFAYQLMGQGWAEATVGIDDKWICVTASYLSDALGDLLRAVVNVLGGISENSFSFLEEPGEYYWRLQRVGEEQLTIEISWFDDWRQIRNSPGKVIFQGTCRLRTFAGAVADSCQRLLEEYGRDGYREKWGNYDFPLDRLDELQLIIRHRDKR